jgi:hypothetical protein
VIDDDDPLHSSVRQQATQVKMLQNVTEWEHAHVEGRRGENIYIYEITIIILRFYSSHVIKLSLYVRLQ